MGSQHHRSLRATPRSAPLLAEGENSYLHVNMHIDDTEGHSVRSTGFLAVFKRGCIRCGPVDSQAKKMGIKTGVIFWNLIFFMMVTCVRGKSRSYSEGFFFFSFLCIYVCGWRRAWSGCRERKANRAAECLRIEAHLLNAGIERGLNKYSCSMLERIRELLVVIK